MKEVLERGKPILDRKAVFGKAEVEERGHRDGGTAELLLLFDEVGTTDVADSAL